MWEHGEMLGKLVGKWRNDGKTSGKMETYWENMVEKWWEDMEKCWDNVGRMVGKLRNVGKMVGNCEYNRLRSI